MGSAITRLKEELNINELLGFLGVIVPFRTGWVSCRCPFHNDRVASAAVNSTKGRFKCHACDASGDVVDLAKLYLGTSDTREAITWLTQTFSISP